MTIYRVEAPDGQILRVEGPENAPQDQIVNFAIAQYLGSRQPAVEEPVAAPKPKDRTWGEAATDIGASLASGIGSLAQLPGQIGTLAGIYKPEEMDTGLQGIGRQLEKTGQAMKSEQLKAKEAARAQKVGQAEGIASEFWTAIKETATDPALMTSFFAEQVPNLIGSMGGGLLTKGAVKLAMRNATEQTLAKAAATGLVDKAAVAGAVGTGAIMQGADIGTETFENLFDKLVRDGMPRDKAAEVALDKGRMAALEAASISGLTAFLPGGTTLERALVGRGLPRTGGILKGFAGEAAQEGLEEGGGKLVSNIQEQSLYPETDIFKGVGSAAGMGALMGGTFGGLGGVSLRAPKAAISPPITEPTAETEATIAEPAPGKTEAQQEGEALAGMLQEREIQQGIYEPEAQPEVVPPVPPVAQPEVTVPPIQEPQAAPTVEAPVAQPMAEAPIVEPPQAAPVSPATGVPMTEAQIAANNNYLENFRQTQNSAISEQEPQIPSGYTRFYHGGYPEGVDGPLYFTTDRQNAEGWAGRDPGMGVYYVDVPNNDPRVDWGDISSGMPMKVNQELPPEIANNRVRIEGPIKKPAPPVETKPLPADVHPLEAWAEDGVKDADKIRQDATKSANAAGIDVQYGVNKIDPELTTVDWNEISKFKNLGGLLNHIQPHVPVDYAEIIKKILPSVKNIPLNVVNRVGGAPRALGAYKPAIVKATGDVVRHSVELSTANNGNDISTIVHEALHGATVSNYYRGKKGNETYAQAAKDLDSLTRKLFALVNEGKANLPFMQDYKRANLARELISWGQTDREVQAELKKIVMPNKKTAWSEFVTTMRKLLGLPANQTTALEHLLDISERLTSQQDVLRGAPRGSVQEEVDVLAKEARTPEFRKWFGDSKIVDANGNPLVVYHGTKRDFTEFKPAYDDGLIFFTTNPEFASKWPVGSGGLRQAPEGTEQEYRRIRQLESDLYSQYMRPSDEYDFNTSEGRTAYDKDRTNLKDAIKKATGYSSGIEFEQKAGIRVIPAYLSIKNPFDPRVDYKKIEEFLTKQGKQDVVNAGYHKSGNWLVYENKDVINELKRLGYDGIYIAEDLGGPHETIAAFRPNQAKSVFNERPTEEEDILAKETPEQVQSRHRTIENELIKSANNSIPELDEMGRKERLVDSIVYNLGDKFKDLKDIQDSLKADIKEKLAKFNAHMREALYHGRIAKQTADFEKDELLPLAQQMYARGVSKEELNNHLLARRAEEYNDKIDARIDQESGQFSHLQGRGSGVATQIADAYLRGVDKNEVAQLRRLFTDNEGKSTLTSNETKLLDQLEKMTPQKRKSLEELSQRVYKMVEKTQQLAIDNGLETKETVDYWRDTSPNYVPLKRSEEELDFAMAHSGAGRGFSVKAGISKAATGSLKTVDDILDNIILQRDMAIVKGEKARIARAFFGITLAAPNPKLYMAVDPETSVIGQANKVLARLQYLRAKLADLNAKIQIDMDQEGSAVATDLARADEMHQQIQKLDAQYTDLAKKAEAVKQKIEQELEANGYDPKDIKNLFLEPQGVWYNPKTKKIEYRTNSFLRSSENVIAVPINGSTKYIFMNTGSERAMRLAKSFKNADVEQLGMATALVARFTRYISAINTQWNPVFGIINVMRDIQGAQLNLSTTALKGKQLAVDKNIIPAVTSIWQSLRSGQPSGKFGQEWLEFQKLGGQTGIKDMLVNIRKNESILDKELAKLQESGVQKIARSSVRAIFGIISDFNDTMENAVRLAAFIEAKKVFGEKYSPDLAADKAADLAKNLTVNFNRKGAKTNILNSWVGFFNASAQGTARLIETLKGPSGKKIMSSLVLLGAIQQMMIAAAGFRDDDPPEFVRERNLIIPTGDGKYKTWPMPLGFNLFVNFGRLLTSTVESGGKNAAKNIASLMNVTLQTFNPLGGENVAQAITPTIGEIPLALATNVDAFGRPIYREDRPGRPMPGYLRSTEGATEISKGLAEIMNKMTGGTDYQKGWASPTADQIDYIAGQLGGGVFREARKTYEYGKAKAAGEEVAPYRVPLAGRFMGDTGSEANVRNRFYESMNKMASYEAEIKGRLTHGQPIQDFLKETPEARMYQTANTFENEVNKINKMRKQMIERGASKEELKRLNERKIQIMRQFNAMYDKVTESEYPSQ